MTTILAWVGAVWLGCAALVAVAVAVGIVGERRHQRARRREINELERMMSGE